MKTVNVVIVGASGYTGEELVRWLLRHPKVHLTGVTSRQFKGKRLEDIFGLLPVRTSLQFEDLSADQIAERSDVVFLALPHGVASEFVVPLRKLGRIVIDLSADFRLRNPNVYREFYSHDHPAPSLLPDAVYANPTLHREQIRTSNLLACPGCYPTSILLPLLPALRGDWINPASIVASSLSGVSGAGKKAELPLLFGEINENMRAYNVPKHRHLSEIEQELEEVTGQQLPIVFIPHLMPLTRGMHTTITADLKKPVTAEGLQSFFETFYQNEPFVRVLAQDALPEVKHVTRTNWCELAVRVDERTNKLMLFSAIDNLVKGAGGQAIQAMNIRLGYPEDEGLNA